MKPVLKYLNIKIRQISGICNLRIAKFFLVLLLASIAVQVSAQEEAEVDAKVIQKPVRSMFESTWLIDNQTVIVPAKGTFQMDIIHRFGVWKNGYDDFYGLFAPSNIKLGFAYTVVDNLLVGFGLTKEKMTLDFNLKYALLKQTRSGSLPLSVSYYGNMAIDTRPGDNFLNSSDRMSYFHQLIIARKMSDKLSIQIAPSVSHFNTVDAYLSPDKEILGLMENDHIAISVGGRYKIKDQMAFIASYDQPITEHLSNNPNPNISFGLELSTSAHAFQFFVTNGKSIVPQRNNVFNSNDFGDNDILIGFNITRLWSY